MDSTYRRVIESGSYIRGEKVENFELEWAKYYGVKHRIGVNDHIIGPRIQDNARIGAAANLLPGVNIGKGAIFGASSLVTRDVPASVKVMGISARIVGEAE